jgi:hypothetical protein
MKDMLESCFEFYSLSQAWTHSVVHNHIATFLSLKQAISEAVSGFIPFKIRMTDDFIF